MTSLRQFVQAVLLFVLACGPALANDFPNQWEVIEGSAVDIAVSGEGEVVAVGSAGDLYQFDSSDRSWSPIGAPPMTRVTFDSENRLWGIDQSGQLRVRQGSAWFVRGVGATDLAAGSEDTLWVVTNTSSIARYTPSTRQWESEAGTAVRLAVDALGILWRINSAGEIARKLDDAWIGVPGTATDIGSDDQGRILIVGTDLELYFWDESISAWGFIQTGVGPSSIAAGAGQLWASRSNGQIVSAGLNPRSSNPGVIEENPGGGGSTDSSAVVDNSPIIFEEVPDSTQLTELAIGTDGSVFGLTSSGDIRRWSNSTRSFKEFPGKVDQIAVGSDGLPLAIGTRGNLVEHDGVAWRLTLLSLDLIDLSLNAEDELVALTDRDKVAVVESNLQRYNLANGLGKQVAYQNDGRYWLIDGQDRLTLCAIDSPCQTQGILVLDLAVGPGGSLFIVDNDYSLRRLDPSTDQFVTIRSGNTARVAVGPNDRPWIIDRSGQVLQSRYFERDESNDDRLAQLSEATASVTESEPNSGGGIQITESLSFTAVDVPTILGGFSSGQGLRDLSSGYEDTVIVTGYEDMCGTQTLSGRNFVYDPVSRTFSELSYLKRANVFVALAIEKLVRSSGANGETPPMTPAPALKSIIGEYQRDCNNDDLESRLFTYVSSAFTDSNAALPGASRFSGAEVFAAPLGTTQEPDIDVAADGWIAQISLNDELELFKPETADDVGFFDQVDFKRVGVGKTDNDLWVVTTNNNVYSFEQNIDQWVLRSQNADDKAQDVGVGHDGTVYIVNTAGVLKRWDPLTQRFIKTNKSGVTRVAVDSRGNPIVANFPDSNRVYFGR